MHRFAFIPVLLTVAILTFCGACVRSTQPSVPAIRYYADWVWTLSGPRGIFELTPARIRTRSSSFALQTDESGRVVRVTRQRYDGRPADNADDPRHPRAAAVIALEYDSASAVSAVRLYQENGLPVCTLTPVSCDGGRVWNLSEPAGFARLQNLFPGALDNPSLKNHFTTASSVIGSVREKRIGTNQVRLDYYTQSGARGEIPLCSAMLTLDSQGRIAEVHFADHAGRAVPCAAGGYGVRYEYQESALTRLLLLDAAGKAAPDWFGVMAERYSYDRSGNRTRVEFLDIDSQPRRHPYYQYAMRQTEYDGHGRPVRIAYFDEFGVPCTDQSGIAALVRTTGHNAPESEWMVHDVRNQVASCSLSYSGYREETDASGMVRSIQYLSPDGTPCIRDGGYSRRIERRSPVEWCKSGKVEFEYLDKQGRVVREVNAPLSVQLNPRIAVFSGERSESTFDVMGRLLVNRSVPVTPLPEAPAVSYTHFRYNGFEQLPCKIFYTDPKGGRILYDDAAECVLRRPDGPFGRMLVERYGLDGKRLSGEDRIPVYREKRDVYNNLIGREFLDSGGHRAANLYGVSAWVKRYTPNGRMLSIMFLDSEDQPVKCEQDYAVAYYTFDAPTGRLQADLFSLPDDPDQSCTRIAGVYHVRQTSISGQDKFSMIECFDPDGARVMCRAQYAKLERNGDKFIRSDRNLDLIESIEELRSCPVSFPGAVRAERKILAQFTDSKTGALVKMPQPVVSVSLFDQQDRLMLMYYPDRTDRPLFNPQDSFVWQYLYRSPDDVHAYKVLRLDAGLKRTCGADGVSGWLQEHNGEGECVFLQYFDLNDRIVNGPEHFAGWRKNVDSETIYFDCKGQTVTPASESAN